MSEAIDDPCHERRGLSRMEWYAALLNAHGATRSESVNALLVPPDHHQQLLQAAQRKIGDRSRSEIRRWLIPSTDHKERRSHA